MKTLVATSINLISVFLFLMPFQNNSKKAMIYIRLIFISFFLLQSSNIFAQNPLIIKRSQQHSKIEFLTDLDTAPVFEYGSQNLNIYKIAISNASEVLVGILEKDKNNPYGSSQLTVFNRAGKILNQEDSVLEFSWNTVGNALVLTKGEKNPDGLDDPKSWKIIDFSQNSGREVSLEMKHYYPFHLNWIKNEQLNTIYFRSNDIKTDFAVVAYDVNQKSFSKTDFISNSFSPDGQYLAISDYQSSMYRGCDKENCFKIVQLATGKVVEYFSNQELGEPYGWIGDSGHRYLFEKNYRSLTASEPAENFLYDVETEAILDQFEGKIINGLRRNNVDYFVSKEYLLLNSSEYGQDPNAVKLYRYEK